MARQKKTPLPEKRVRLEMVCLRGLLHWGELKALYAHALVGDFHGDLEFVSTLLEFHGDRFGFLPVANGEWQGDINHGTAVDTHDKGPVGSHGTHSGGEVVLSVCR